MTTGQLQECLEEAFGDLEPPHFEEVFACADLDGLDQAIRTETGRAKRWQELRPLRKYQLSSLALYVLTPKAYHYYLPAYLYAMIVQMRPTTIWNPRIWTPSSILFGRRERTSSVV